MVKLRENDVVAITTDKYLEIAKESADLSEKKARRALQFFHDTRLALHYDCQGLSNMVIVSPSKVIHGFKQIFRHDLKEFLECWTKDSFQMKRESLRVSPISLNLDISQLPSGIVSHSLLQILWNDNGQEGEIPFLVNFLKQCNFAIQIHPRQLSLLIPWLCLGPEPEVVSQLVPPDTLPQHTLLCILFPYFMPPSLFVLFVARCCSVLQNNEKFQDKFHWKNGLFIDLGSSCLKVTNDVKGSDGKAIVF